MGFNPDIRKEICRLANTRAAEMKEKSIYESVELNRYLSGLSGTLQGDPRKAMRIHIMSGGKEGMTACTNGGLIIMNWENELFSRYSSRETRFEAFLGGFYHELSHILFYDFDGSAEAERRLRAGLFYGEEPVPRSEEEERNLAELKAAMQKPEYQKVFSSIWGNLDNILADRHDEDRMTERYGRLVRGGIGKIRESIHSYLAPFEEMAGQVSDGKMEKLTPVLSAILQLSRYGSVFMYDSTLWGRDEILAAVRECITDVEDAVCEDDLRRRYACMNRIVLKVWPFIREIIEKIDGKSGQETEDGEDGQSSAQAPSDDALNSVMEAISAASENMTNASHPENRKTSQNAQNGSKSANCSAGRDENRETEESGRASQSILGNVVNEIAVKEAEEETERAVAKDTVHRIETVDMNSSHSRFPLIAGRNLDRTEPERCREISDRIRPYTKRLCRYMEEALRDIRRGGTLKHRQFGRIFVPNDAYRPDGKCYAKRNVPGDLPDMAVSILVDNSGSMSDDGRIQAAREAALMVYDYATAVNVPVQVSGHTTCGQSVVYNVYADFERVTDRDRERIAAMEPGMCNRDGYAIEIAANLLSSRPESYRLLIIISDGLPNHIDYGGEGAAEDIRSIVRRYRKQGIEIIAAAIGSDSEQIGEIYGEGFLDISSLDRLPRTMAKLIQKRLLRQIA